MKRLTDVSGIILAGGSSLRLGQDKALIQINGEPLIRRVASVVLSVVERAVVITNSPESFAFLELPLAGDIYPDVGTLGGLHAGLSAITATYGLVVGCDMPFLNPHLLRYMLSLREGYDVVMPHIGEFFEPLHAIYARDCRLAFERHILSGQRRVRPACEGMRIRYVSREEITSYDPRQLSFFNINTPQDLERMHLLLAQEGC